MSNTILVLEDDFAINQLLSTQLKNEGYKVIQAFDGEEAIEVFNNQIDLALLDIMVPKKDGVAVLQHIRKISVIPVIFLTAKGEETDKLIALGLGADDYVTKPFSVMEVMYRVKAQLRRHFTYNKKEVVDHEELVHDDLRINLKTFTLLKAGRPVELSVKEFELLSSILDRFLPNTSFMNKFGGIPTMATTTPLWFISPNLEKKLGIQQKILSTLKL